jgi:hypothetical protein
MTGNSALAMFEAMLMIFTNLLAEAGARIGHLPHRADGNAIRFHGLMWRLPLRGRRLGSLRKDRQPPALRPTFARGRMNRDRKRGVPSVQRPQPFDVRSEGGMSIQPVPG